MTAHASPTFHVARLRAAALRRGRSLSAAHGHVENSGRKPHAPVCPAAMSRERQAPGAPGGAAAQPREEIRRFACATRSDRARRPMSERRQREAHPGASWAGAPNVATGFARALLITFRGEHPAPKGVPGAQRARATAPRHRAACVRTGRPPHPGPRPPAPGGGERGDLRAARPRPERNCWSFDASPSTLSLRRSPSTPSWSRSSRWTRGLSRGAL